MGIPALYQQSIHAIVYPLLLPFLAPFFFFFLPPL
jgi:hypothetical protein